MKTWAVIILPGAEADIRRIYDYISATLLEPTIAGRFIERVKKAIQSLDTMPERYRLYDKKPWRSKGLRLFSVGSYVVFYHVAQEVDVVYVDAVLYGARDLERALGKMQVPNLDENQSDC